MVVKMYLKFCMKKLWKKNFTPRCMFLLDLLEHVIIYHHHCCERVGLQNKCFSNSNSYNCNYIPSLMHTNYFCRTIKAVKLILVGHFNWDEPFSSTVLAPKPTHHHEQNIGRMRGLQRVGHLYKAVIWASEATTNRDSHGHQPQSAFLSHVNGTGVIHSAQNEGCAIPISKLYCFFL